MDKIFNPDTLTTASKLQKKKMAKLLVASLLLGVATAIYPADHWTFATKLTDDATASAFVKDNVDAGKTVRHQTFSLSHNIFFALFFSSFPTATFFCLYGSPVINLPSFCVHAPPSHPHRCLCAGLHRLDEADDASRRQDGTKL